MNTSTTPNDAAQDLYKLTLFWASAFASVSSDAKLLLHKKVVQLNALTKVSFESLTPNQVQRMNYLEEEIRVFEGLIAAAEDVVSSHIKATGAVADLLLYTWANAECYKQQFNDRNII